MFVNIIQSQNSNVFPEHLFFLLVHGHYKIPKLMASADEMYLRCCLESVHNSALKASQHNKPVSLNTVKFVGEAECDSGQLVLGHSVAVSNNASDNWTLGTVMGTKSMINILNSPLLQHFGASEGNDNLNSMNFTDAKNMTCYDFKDSPSSSYKLEMETPMVQSHEYGSISVHKRTTSKTNSTYDQKEVYVAKLSKVDTTHDEDLDYVYLFHLNKGCEIPDRDLQLVGKMNLSTYYRYTLSPPLTITE
eukprot:XP_025980035.1 uncharacterized protein LOC102667989 [Glycine max]